MKPIIWNTLGIICLVIVTVVILIFAKAVLIPIAFAFFCAFLLRPGVNKLRSKKVPNIISIIIMTLALIIGIGIIFSAFGYALSTFTKDIPKLQETIKPKLEVIDAKFYKVFKTHLPLSKSAARSKEQSIQTPDINFGKIFTSTATTIGTIPVIFVLTFLILLYRQKFKKFALKLTHGKHRDAMEKTLEKIGSVIPSYLLGVITVASILTILLFLGLWALGVPSALFFAILIALLNIIPYAGTILGFILLFVFTILTQGTGTIIAVVILFFVTQFLDNNFLTPMISGRKIDLNPLSSILGIIIGGLLWGVAGMVIALPILGILKILCNTIPGLEAFGYLLGTE